MTRSVWPSLTKFFAMAVLALLPFSAHATNDKNLLQNMAVSGTLSDGGTFAGKFTVTRFGYDETKGFTVDGVVQGQARTADGRVQHVSQEVFGIPATLNEGSATGVTTQAVCDILTLDIGAIHLDLLGLVLDLAPINLDLTAVSGPGNLLGNLLCAVAGLLDPAGFLDQLLGSLQQLLQLIELINSILGAL